MRGKQGIVLLLLMLGLKMEVVGILRGLGLVLLIPRLGARNLIGERRNDSLRSSLRENMFCSFFCELGSGLSLEKVMVWQLNAVYQGEQKIMKYISRINPSAEHVRQIHEEITNIND